MLTRKVRKTFDAATNDDSSDALRVTFQTDNEESEKRIITHKISLIFKRQIV